MSILIIQETVIYSVQCDTQPCGVETQGRTLNPKRLHCAASGATNSPRLTLVNTAMHNMPAHTTKDVTPSAVTTHHADTKEDAAQKLCER